MRLEQALVDYVARARAAAKTPAPAAEALRGPGIEAMQAAARVGGNASVLITPTLDGARLTVTGRGATAAREAARRMLPSARAELARRWREQVVKEIG